MLGYLLDYMSWRAVFIASAILIGGVTAWLYFSLHDEPEGASDGNEDSESHLTHGNIVRSEIANDEHPHTMETESQTSVGQA